MRYILSQLAINDAENIFCDLLRTKYINEITMIFLSQLQVVGYDSYYPNNKATESITITVNRNPNPPSFTQNSYAVTISDSFPVMNQVTQITAADPDGVSVVQIENVKCLKLK